jgi:hypothetical protein
LHTAASRAATGCLHPGDHRRRVLVAAIKGNDKHLLAEVPANAQPRHDAATASPDDELAAEVDYLREQLAQARERAARAEERAIAVRELADRLAVELANARRPWLARVLAAIRR